MPCRSGPIGVALQSADEVVSARGRRIGVGEALIKIGLAVAIQVVQPGDLVAAEHIGLAVGDHQSQGLVQARRQSASSGRFSASGRDPRLAKHLPASSQSMAVPSAKKSRSPKKSSAFHGLRNGGSIVSITYGHEPAWPRPSLGRDHLRPLSVSAARRRRQRMKGGWGDDSRELAVFDPRGIEHLDIADTISEHDLFAVPIKPVINKRLVGPGAGGSRPRRAIHDQAVHKAVAHGRELDESPAPDGLVTKGLGVEACRQFAALAQPDAYPLGNRHARAAKDTAQYRPQLGLVPSVVSPGSFVLVAPVAVASAVESREAWVTATARSTAS